MNLAKVKATEEYLLRTDHIFIVASIDRAVSNVSLKESLLGALRQHMPNELDEQGPALPVTVICTRSEPSDTLVCRFSRLAGIHSGLTLNRRKSFLNLKENMFPREGVLTEGQLKS